MKVTALSIPVVFLLFSFTLRGAEPHAQQYVAVHKVRDLDDPAKAVCVGTPDILQLPSGRLIASMELWLKRPTSGDEGGIDYPNHCKIKASDDGGTSWREISTNGITWGSLFYVVTEAHRLGGVRCTDRSNYNCVPAKAHRQRMCASSLHCRDRDEFQDE